MTGKLIRDSSRRRLKILCQSVRDQSSVASRQHRSVSRVLVVPRRRLNSYGRRAFSVAGPAI